jgi:hypothetical protein
MQNLELVQETEVGQFAPLMIAGVAHDLPLNVMELPERSTAMQKFALAQEIELSQPLSMLVSADQEEPSYVMASPSMSTAAQKVALEHETEVKRYAAVWAGADQDLPSQMSVLPE